MVEAVYWPLSGLSESHASRRDGARPIQREAVVGPLLSGRPKDGKKSGTAGDFALSLCYRKRQGSFYNYYFKETDYAYHR